MKSISELYTELREPLYQFVLSKVESRDDAEDILHDVFLRASQSLNSLRAEEKVQNWVYQIARNAITDYYRSKKPTQSLIEIDEDSSTQLIATHEDINPIERLAASTRIFIDELPEPYRAALIKTELESVSQVQLARELGISVSGVKSRVQRARKMLREKLEECCRFELSPHHVLTDYHQKPTYKGAACGNEC